MLLNWVVIWEQIRQAEHRRQHSPLDDPLDRPEWRGLLWILPLLEVFGRSKQRRKRTNSKRGGATRLAAYCPVSKLNRST